MCGIRCNVQTTGATRIVPHVTGGAVDGDGPAHLSGVRAPPPITDPGHGCEKTLQITKHPCYFVQTQILPYAQIDGTEQNSAQTAQQNSARQHQPQSPKKSAHEYLFENRSPDILPQDWGRGDWETVETKPRIFGAKNIPPR